MPFATSFDPARRLIITRAWGHITLPDLRGYQQDLGQRQDFDATWAHVFDARDAVQFDSARRAMVATHPAIYGVFRMYGTSRDLRAGGPEIGVFTTLEEAIEWVTS